MSASAACPFAPKTFRPDCKRAWASYQVWISQNKCAHGKADSEADFMEDCTQARRVSYGCLERTNDCAKFIACEEACRD